MRTCNARPACRVIDAVLPCRCQFSVDVEVAGIPHNAPSMLVNYVGPEVHGHCHHRAEHRRQKSPPATPSNAVSRQPPSGASRHTFLLADAHRLDKGPNKATAPVLSGLVVVHEMILLRQYSQRLGRRGKKDAKYLPGKSRCLFAPR